VEVVRVASSDIRPAPEITRVADSYYLSGVVNVGNRLVVLLNLDRALSAQEAQVLPEVKMG
jgi:chemotaxis signal transduction protein